MNRALNRVYGSIFLFASLGFSGCTLSSDDTGITHHQLIEKERIGFLIKATPYTNLGFTRVEINWMEPLLSIPFITVNGKDPSITEPTRMTFDSLPMSSHIYYSILYNEKILSDSIDISSPIDTLFYNGVAVDDTIRVVYVDTTKALTFSWKGEEHASGYLVSLNYKGQNVYSSELLYQNEVTINEPDSGYTFLGSSVGAFSIEPIRYEKIYIGGSPQKEENGLFAHYDIRPPSRSFSILQLIDGVIIVTPFVD